MAISPLQRARQNLAANVVLQGRGGTRHSAGATSGQLGPRQPRPLRARRSTSSAAGRPLTSHTSAFSRFSAGRRALSRFSKQQGPGSLRSFRLGGDGTRWVGDVYFLLDGGMAHTSLHKAFQSKDKVSKSLTVLKDVISVDSKHEHPADRPC